MILSVTDLVLIPKGKGRKLKKKNEIHAIPEKDITKPLKGKVRVVHICFRADGGEC